LNDATNDGFVAGAGETLTLLGSGVNSGDDLVPLTIVFSATAEAALLNALNSGDRKATIGVQNGSSAWTYLSSSERNGGIYAPSLSVIAVPEAQTVALATGLFALLITSYFRRKS
jgi:hypothetical protein